MSNGLDDLNNRRQARKRRTPPPPAHPRSTQPEPPPTPAPAGDAPPEAPPAPPQPARPDPAPAARPRSDARRSGRTPSVEAYLDAELMEWLRQAEDAGYARRERAVISPVVRLALRQLAEHMTPAQAVEAALRDRRD